MSKKLIIIIAIVLVFLLGIISGLNIKSKAFNCPPNANSRDIYQAGWNAAEQKLNQAQKETIPIEIKGISGTVEKIDGNKLTVKVAQFYPSADSSLNERIVDIDSHTKVFQMVQKNPQEYQKEITDFRKAVQAQIENQPQNGSAQPQTVVPPAPFEKKQISLSDIKVGEQISIISDSDIKTAEEFKAVEIDINQSIENSPVAPSATPTIQASSTTAK